MKDFKDFLLRGNLVTTAVAFVIGVAFAGVVTALVADLITPLIAAIGGNADFSTLHFTINNSVFLYGSFLNALITFVVIAAVIFFLVVKPVNALMDRMKTEPPLDETVQACPHCLSSIPVAASVCSFCTRDVGAAAA
jgi:large conductance mechanosensitive channel